MNNHRKGINNRVNLQICYDPKFRTFTYGLFVLALIFANSK